MLSSGMIPRHRPLAPARRGGAARSCDSSVFSPTSAISVSSPALSPRNPSFVFIRLRTLSFSVCNIFPFKLFAFNPFRTLSENTGGGYQLFPKWNSTHSAHPAPTYSSSFFSHSCALFCAMGATQPFWNQSVPHSFYRNGGSMGITNQGFFPALSWNRVLMPQSPCFAFRFSNAVSRRFPEPFGPSIRISCQVRFVPGSVGVAHQKEASSNVQASLEAFPRSCSSLGRAAALCAFTHRRPDGQVLRFRPLDS